MNKSILRLDKAKSANRVYSLNGLLANFQIYFQNLRGLHWNIKRKNFFELHAKFEEFYTDSQLKVDDIAKCILTLQGKPLHTFTDYIKRAFVPVGKNISNDVEGVELVVNSLLELLKICNFHYKALVIIIYTSFQLLQLLNIYQKLKDSYN